MDSGSLDSLSILMGSVNKSAGISLLVERITVHPDYQDSAQPFSSDLTILKLVDPGIGNLTSRLMPICLPRPDTNDQGVKLTAAGWGYLRYYEFGIWTIFH